MSLKTKKVYVYEPIDAFDQRLWGQEEEIEVYKWWVIPSATLIIALIVFGLRFLCS